MPVREIVAIAALLVAVVIAAQFLDPAASESKGSATVVHLGDPPTPPPLPTATPTPAPSVNRVPAPANGWLLEFFETGFSRPSDQGFNQDLDVSLQKPPFPDYRDGRWRLRATASIDVQAGISTFQLRHLGALTVTIDGVQVASDEGSGLKVLDVRFEHAAGHAQVAIETADIKGPFELHWLPR